MQVISLERPITDFCERLNPVEILVRLLAPETLGIGDGCVIESTIFVGIGPCALCKGGGRRINFRVFHDGA